tara:strand:- start:109 stop:387 length:279 start_codon:yes stop_codon:yes gene_type:complete
MGFKKGESGNPEGRPKGSLNKTTNEIRELISKAIDTDKIKDMLNQIEEPIDYINAVSKLLPYVAGKVKPIENIKQERGDVYINIVPFDKDEY